MRLTAVALTVALSPITLATTMNSAHASEYVCKGERVERAGSTQWMVRRSGSDLRVEKGGWTVGRAVARNGKFYVEVAGSTKAVIERDRILKAGSTWALISDAERIYDCGPTVASTLWVLAQLGRL